MKFSCLMSLYKKENPAYFKVAMDSILNQTLLPTEIVLVKDGKLTEELDNIINDYVNQYPELFKIVAFDENRGLGLALRDGVLACSYDYIARMDTDDIADKHRFEKQIAYLEQYPEIDLLGSAISEFSDDENKPDSTLFLPTMHDEIVKFAKLRNPFKHPTVVFKKTAVISSGNYRHFMWFEDYDLFIRIINNGCKTANLNEILVNVRSNKDQFARRGGLQYAKQDLAFQFFLYSIGFIGMIRFLTNTIMRVLVRLMPNRVRTILYQKLLRNK